MNPNSISVDLFRFQPKLELKKRGGKVFLFDPIRDKFLVQTPEELVRQLLIQFLLDDLAWPARLIAVEKLVRVNERRKRFDLLCFLPAGKPILLIECKSPKVPISLDVFEQISAYNLALKVPYLLVANGISAYCCRVDLEKGNYEFLDRVPGFPELSS